MSSIPPEVANYFDQQKREQKTFIDTALVKKNLRQTTVTAINVLDQLVQRGTQLNVAVEQADELNQSSHLFLLHSPHFHCRYCQYRYYQRHNHSRNHSRNHKQLLIEKTKKQ